MKLVVGTRGSNLALVQTNWVVDQLKKANPGVEFEVKIIKTKGDLIKDLPLDKIGDKGLFVKEIGRWCAGSSTVSCLSLQRSLPILSGWSNRTSTRLFPRIEY